MGAAVVVVVVVVVAVVGRSCSTRIQMATTTVAAGPHGDSISAAGAADTGCSDGVGIVAVPIVG